MGLCHLQENAFFKIYTQSCIFYGISGSGQGSGTSSLGDEIPYYVQIHFQVVSEEDFPPPEPNARRTSLVEGGGRENPERNA